MEDLLKDISKTFVINLERRPDRYNEFVTNIKKNGFNIDSIIRIDAVDGKKLNSSDYKISNLGVVGCHLSHRKIWNEVINDETINDDDIVLIFEDDVHFTKNNFCDRFKNVIEKFKNIKGDKFLYIGGRFHENYTPTNKGFKTFTKIEGELFKNQNNLKGCTLTSHAYVLTKGVCKNLYNNSCKGNPYELDHFLKNCNEKLNIVYECIPHLCYSPICYKTDIQYCAKSVHANNSDVCNNINRDVCNNSHNSLKISGKKKRSNLRFGNI